MTPLDETIKDLVAGLTLEDQAMFAAEPEDHPGGQFHMSLGMGMRNSLHLWEHDTPLTKWFSEQNVFHGDDRSGIIFKALWCTLNDRPFDIKAESEHYRAYWEAQGLRPDGSPLPKLHD